MDEKEIRITCRGADVLPLDAIEEFQGNLKKRSPEVIKKLISSIELYGFTAPFFVWNGDGHNRCIDGHGRIQALQKMRQKGYDLPLFPVVYINAKDEKEAKERLLAINSRYGIFDFDGAVEFCEGLTLSNDIFEIPELDMEVIIPDTDFVENEVEKIVADPGYTVLITYKTSKQRAGLEKLLGIKIGDVKQRSIDASVIIK